jgi:hypothetical protein
MYKSTPQNPKRKPSSVKGSKRSATNSDNKTAETRTPQTTAIERIEERAYLRLKQSIELRESGRWVNYWTVEYVRKSDRPDFEAAIDRLRKDHAEINRLIDRVAWDRRGVTVWFRQGGLNHG